MGGFATEGAAVGSATEGAAAGFQGCRVGSGDSGDGRFRLDPAEKGLLHKGNAGVLLGGCPFHMAGRRRGGRG